MNPLAGFYWGKKEKFLQYNPILDLVTGIVMILAPILLLIGCGVWMLASRAKHDPTLPSSPPETPIGDEILRSIELLRQHQDRLIEEMRDLSDENRKSLRVLQEETERIRNLLKRETASSGTLESRLENLEYRDN